MCTVQEDKRPTHHRKRVIITQCGQHAYLEATNEILYTENNFVSKNSLVFLEISDVKTCQTFLRRKRHTKVQTNHTFNMMQWKEVRKKEPKMNTIKTEKQKRKIS